MNRPKVLIEIEKFDEKNGHKHSGEVGDGPLLSSSSIEDNSITDNKIGDIILDQNEKPLVSTGKLRNILNWFSNRIKSITGKNNWWEDPDISLNELANYNETCSLKDSNGIFLKIEYRTPIQDKLFMTSELSDLNKFGKYSKVTWKFYNSSEILYKTKVWTLTYDTDGDIVKKEVI